MQSSRSKASGRGVRERDEAAAVQLPTTSAPTKEAVLQWIIGDEAILSTAKAINGMILGSATRVGLSFIVLRQRERLAFRLLVAASRRQVILVSTPLSAAGPLASSRPSCRVTSKVPPVMNNRICIFLIVELLS